jgi:hypothetical protein|uniref:Uncharacterized protein n=1 Tax=Sipha flava TaxID=143950 RepID=A0A2S2R2U3_9HEMI
MPDPRSSDINKNSSRTNDPSQNNSNRPPKPSDKNVNKKLTINTNTNIDVRNYSDDSEEQLWTTNKSKRQNSPGLSPKTKEQKILKTNSSKFSTPNRFEDLKDAVTSDTMDMTEQTKSLLQLRHLSSSPHQLISTIFANPYYRLRAKTVSNANRLPNTLNSLRPKSNTIA